MSGTKLALIKGQGRHLLSFGKEVTVLKARSQFRLITTPTYNIHKCPRCYNPLAGLASCDDCGLSVVDQYTLY